MVSCRACGVSHKARAAGISFHKFPNNQLIRAKWISFLEPTKHDLPVNLYLCSKHFAEDCFDRTSRFKVQLRTSAIPTIRVFRQKFSRTPDNELWKHVKLEPQSTTNENTSSSRSPSPSLIEETPPVLELSEESPSRQLVLDEVSQTPKNRKLMKMIESLIASNILQKNQIRRLQKAKWRQSKTIFKLTETIQKLEEKNANKK